MRYQPVSNEKWPNAQQRLLLRAALTSGDAGLEAWKQWNGTNGINSNVDRFDLSNRDAK